MIEMCKNLRRVERVKMVGSQMFFTERKGFFEKNCCLLIRSQAFLRGSNDCQNGSLCFGIVCQVSVHLRRTSLQEIACGEFRAGGSGFFRI